MKVKYDGVTHVLKYYFATSDNTIEMYYPKRMSLRIPTGWENTEYIIMNNGLMIYYDINFYWVIEHDGYDHFKKELETYKFTELALI